MAVGVTHTFVSPLADEGNPNEVGPDEWNAAHTITGLGTAAEADSTDFATAAQGAKADTAVQPAAIANMLETSDIGVSVQAHSAVLDATTASFLTAHATKLGHISVTQAVDLDTIEAAAAASKIKTDFLTVTQAVDLDDIETRVNSLDAAVVLRGSWDASAGTFPGGGTAQAGDSYIVSVAGTVNSVAFALNDRIIAITDNASTTTFAANWFKADYTDQVLSVAGKTGAVTLVAADLTDVTATATELNYTDGVTSAIQTQLDAKQPLDTDLTALATAFSAASASGPASLSFLEDTDNGTNKVTISAPSAITADRAFVLPDVDVTISTFGASLMDDAAASNARTTLGLGTAATQNTSTSGANIPLMNAANSWSANQTFTTSVDSATVATFTSTDTGANAGPYSDWIRDSASPANNDALGLFRYIGRNGSAALTAYSLLVANIKTVTAGAEDGQFRILNLVAGAQQTVMDVQAGMQLGAPTGADKGLGSLNAKDVYNDNVALTCMATQKEFIETGTVDLRKWDALVPPDVTPERVEMVPITERVEVTKERLVDTPEGKQIERTRVTEERQIVDLMPVYEEDGRTGVGAVEVPAFEKVIIPARIVPREHKMARAFKAMFQDGFDPRNPAAYIAKLRSDEALPGMPKRSEWEHNSMGSGELFMRLWLATEMLALVVMNIHGRLLALEGAEVGASASRASKGAR